MKTYIITLSKTFPKGHVREGEPTHFRDKFLLSKLHTIRANYDLWNKRVEEIQHGEAVLSVRQWTGKPYRSKQEIIAVLDSSSGISIQKLEFWQYASYIKIDGRRFFPELKFIPKLAENDGLSEADFYEWFKTYDKTKPLAIIHFTKYRY